MSIGALPGPVNPVLIYWLDICSALSEICSQFIFSLYRLNYKCSACLEQQDRDGVALEVSLEKIITCKPCLQLQVAQQGVSPRYEPKHIFILRGVKSLTYVQRSEKKTRPNSKWCGLVFFFFVLWLLKEC